MNADSNRVIRGGSWRDYAQCCRSANRSSWGPGGRDDDVGLRLLRTRNPLSSSILTLDPCEAAKRADAQNEIDSAQNKAMKALSDWVDALLPKFNSIEMQELKRRMTSAFREYETKIIQSKMHIEKAELDLRLLRRAALDLLDHSRECANDYEHKPSYQECVDKIGDLIGE